MFSNNNFTYNKSYRCYEQKNKKEKNDYHNDKNKGDENTRENFLFFYFFFLADVLIGRDKFLIIHLTC